MAHGENAAKHRDKELWGRWHLSKRGWPCRKWARRLASRILRHTTRRDLRNTVS